MAGTEKKATANPTKQFFVTMITRDISLEDCILDLIDNSIDGAWSCEGSKPMGLSEGADLAKYRIDITASADCFSITDNCGGMTLDDAANHAFSFGRPALEEQEEYSIGVYGIGMKRAVFKIGRSIRVHSTYLDENDNRDAFVVPIDVDKWLNNDTPPWDFDIEPDEHLASNGVAITIKGLTDGAKTAFDSPAFLQNLRRTIGRDYSLHINRGLVVTLNGEKIVGWMIELRQSEDFAPVRIEYHDQTGEDKVHIEIIAGMAAPPPEDSNPDEEDEGDRRFGWYVVCNGRIVLAADKTTVAGWGTDSWPQWHRQYSGFIGIILFTSANAGALPMTTTKRSVDQSSEIYRRARPKMREASRAWIDYTNVRKQALDQAKQAEARATAVPIYQIVPRMTVSVPKLVAAPRERVANVAYSVPLVRLKRLAKELGNSNMSYRDVGLKSFEYAYDDFVGEE